jgi:SNF2 family DNA or RNA helicase
VRQELLESWHASGGVLIISPDLYRNLVKDKNCARYRELLLTTGPDIVIVDEAHSLKNKKSKLVIELGQIRTTLRIALTGSPIQNNLAEYWTMV